MFLLGFLRNRDSAGPWGSITLGLDLGLTEQASPGNSSYNPGPWPPAYVGQCPDSQHWPELLEKWIWHLAKDSGHQLPPLHQVAILYKSNASAPIPKTGRKQGESDI